MADQDFNEEEQEKNPQKFPVQPAPRMMGDPQDTNAKVHYGTVINVPLCSLTKRRVTDLKECFLALYDTFCIYKVIGRYEQPVDDDLLEGEWKSVKANYRWTRARKDISAVEMFYDNNEGLWTVQMVWKSAGEYNWHFLKGADAKKLHDMLQNYFITRDIKPDSDLKPQFGGEPTTPREK